MNDWQGAACVILASGPSLTLEQCEEVKRWHTAGRGKVIAINTTYRRALWADVLYGCDHTWWVYHIKEVRKHFQGQLWTQSKRSADAYKINYIRSDGKKGISRDPTVINQGQTSVIQAINLAYHWGAKHFILLGCDAAPKTVVDEKGKEKEKQHWHEPHVESIHSPYNDWIKNFSYVAEDLAQDGISIVNCTPGSKLNLGYCDLSLALSSWVTIH